MVDALTEAEVVHQVRETWQDGGWILTANVDIVRAISRDRTLVELASTATLTVADGMPLVWAGRIAGEEIPERVTGSSLVHTLSRAAALDGRSVFLLGGAPGVAERAAAVLQANSPGLKIAGIAAPPVGFDEDKDSLQSVIDSVVLAQPNLVLIGMGFPKQEKLIQRLRAIMPNAWYVGCGAGIPMASGDAKRAPEPLQRMGLEWLHRLVMEPRRLARRYLRDDLPFALTLLAGAAVRRLRR
ncbi:WecB/TagA/CpsF family glycosyltransferase [Kibdelosporangium persicum]|uniref:N-acetylglucosaminyldiphospho-undecaprenol N-acety l-beta-D-mannosaminyltransferase n=1 Tax=Kibdelosporangium persicum TaxID=2698649 RepID=A0ABX2FCZ4_9PSEU|nr:N-acetylglucosaminyldiphospho-undecaprenol N-acety l-beta-D-mannosaminyltransferase [Kibdelosporangium persicum]